MKAFKFLVSFTVFTTLGFGPVWAEDSSSEIVPATIAVIDTGLDASNSFVYTHVLYEVCILSFKLCPNGADFSEGIGSARIPEIALKKNKDFYHGTEMSSIIVRENPEAKIVFIRVVANTSTGAKASTNPLVIGRALQWVSDNAERFNISAVSMSMGIQQKNGTCVADSGFNQAIDQLNFKNIPAFFPAGNGYNYKTPDFPSCDLRTVSVGGLDYIGKNYFPALYSNYSPTVDFFVYGKQTVLGASGNWQTKVGTSAATAALASKFITFKSMNPGISSEEIFRKFNEHSFIAYSTPKTGRYPVTALDLNNLK